MRRLVLHHHHEGLAVLTFFGEPLDRKIRYHIRAIAVDAPPAVGENHIRIIIEPLSRQHRPVVKPLRPTLEMALAVDGRLVTGRLQ